MIARVAACTAAASYGTDKRCAIVSPAKLSASSAPCSANVKRMLQRVARGRESLARVLRRADQRLQRTHELGMQQRRVEIEQRRQGEATLLQARMRQPQARQIEDQL